MKVSLLTLHLFFPATRSLKDKRSIVKRILAEVDGRGAAFAAAEIGDLNDRERAAIRIAHLSGEPRYSDSVLTQLRERLESGRDYVLESYEMELL